MPKARVNGVGIEYEVLGNDGPWILLTQGGRQDKELFRPLAENFAEAGYRVIQYDRRNSGASEIAFPTTGTEDEVFADDMYALCERLGASPVLACGGAGGSRQSIVLTLRHPDSVRGLLLWWPSGSRPAAETLADQYYGQYITVARQGGMEAVAETPYFEGRIQRDPTNRQRLLAIDVADFIATMERWRRAFLDGADMPVIGLEESTLRGLTLPACIIPGGDMIHPRAVAEALAAILPNAEFQDLPAMERPESDEARARSRLDHQRRLAETFIAFARKNWPPESEAPSAVGA
jgi:pimeloyl-ACP methyl ester carboxylesterase